ncbi:hypothetical protein D3C71_1829670 [compost metagenome]
MLFCARYDHITDMIVPMLQRHRTSLQQVPALFNITKYLFSTFYMNSASLVVLYVSINFCIIVFRPGMRAVRSNFMYGSQRFSGFYSKEVLILSLTWELLLWHPRLQPK